MNRTIIQRVCVANMLAASCGLACLANEPAPQQSAADVRAAAPVILLTGFEPFGPDRPPNPSWEGIHSLDGAEWRGYRIVCRQLKVLWGEPLQRLPEWIEQLKPVAIFSFGQGGGFTVETLAHNARGSSPDNAGEPPPRPLIVNDGPAQYATSLDAAELVERLRAAGFAAHQSQTAGRYLCEETLYSLEHLRAAGRGPKLVGFFHVPPLGAATPAGDPVTAETVQAFVQAVLEASRALDRPTGIGPTDKGPGAVLRQAAAAGSPPSEAEQEVRQLIDRYFRSWSSQDLVRYGQCFMPQAVVQLIGDDGSLTTIPLGPFLRSQQEAHRRAAAPMTETPESIQVRFDAKLAHALVYWKLVDGQRVQYGYDHFTLMRHEGGWRIAHLVFYETKPGAGQPGAEPKP